jgi:hypothetical protein
MASKPIEREKNRKGTSIGRGKFKKSSMNKHKKRSYKAYAGQGRSR